MIQVKSFHITEYGDESVGIPTVRWNLQGEFHFNSDFELANFKESLASAFEWICADRPEVLTDAEIQKENETEAAFWKDVDQAEAEFDEMKVWMEVQKEMSKNETQFTK